MWLFIKRPIFARNSLLVFLKEAAACFLLLVFLTQTFSGDLTVADYYLNTAAYAQNCINKDKPMMHCNGRCQMAKKLQQQQKSDKQVPENRSGKSGGALSSTNFFNDLMISNFGEVILERRAEPSFAKAVGMPRDFFHPPDTFYR